MSKVYVVQKQMRREGDGYVPKYDFGPAEGHGELVFMLDDRDNPYQQERVLAVLRSYLEDYTPEDYLLLVGNPCLIGWAVALAADATDTGTVQLLQWNGRHGVYDAVPADIYDGMAELEIP